MSRGDLNASQAGGLNRGAATTDQATEAQIVRVLVNRLGLDKRTLAAIQELAGARGKPSEAALRKSDLAAVARLSQFEAKIATASVTVDDFNALRNEVRQLYEVMAEIARLLKTQ